MRPGYTAAALVFLTIGCVRVITTHGVFSETADEPMHITAGMQVLAEHRYGMQLENPPLPRAAFALLPHLVGVEYQGHGTIAERAHRIFFTDDRYERNLALARAGNLLFFIIAALATWMWARIEAGDLAGVIAMLLFTSHPVILGHAGLATHDVPALAGVAASLLAFTWLLEKPSAARAVAFGAAFGFSILCKFSCIGYVPVACAAIYGVRALKEAGLRRVYAIRLAALLTLAAAAALLLVWAGYGFTTGTIASAAPLNLDAGDTVTRLLAPIWNSMTLPAPRLFAGVAGLAQINRSGFLSYACGKTSYDGWWWYFPLALALKSTIAFLILLALALLARGTATERAARVSAAAAIAMLAPAMLGHLNLGIRYILPIYAPLTLLAASAVTAMISGGKRFRRGAAAVIVGAHLVASAAAHPDYMAYFNAIAGRDPSYYLVDSNLDWGQDILRLARVARELKIATVGVSLMGPADLDRLGFPRHYDLHPSVPTHGWAAISEHSYRLGRVEGGWRWLRGRPYRRIGKSIRLYRVD